MLPDYKAILLALCASICVEYVINDACEHVIEALTQAGIQIGDIDEYSDVLRFLPKPLFSLYGPMNEE